MLYFIIYLFDCVYSINLIIQFNSNKLITLDMKSCKVYDSTRKLLTNRYSVITVNNTTVGFRLGYNYYYYYSFFFLYNIKRHGTHVIFWCSRTAVGDLVTVQIDHTTFPLSHQPVTSD